MFGCCGYRFQQKFLAGLTALNVCAGRFGSCMYAGFMFEFDFHTDPFDGFGSDPFQQLPVMVGNPFVEQTVRPGQLRICGKRVLFRYPVLEECFGFLIGQRL